MKKRDQPLRVELKQGLLSISVGIGTLAYCNNHDERLDGINIVDADAFGKDLVFELNREEEDGTTPVYLLFDKAIQDAADNGAQGYVERVSE